MRPPRLRMTVGTLMIAVALVGLIVFGLITAMRMSRRAESYRSRALAWRSQEAVARTHLVRCRKEIEGTLRAGSRLREQRHNLDRPEELAERLADDAAWWRANAAHTEEVIAYGSMMRRKYEHAARYPWLAVEPDPPAPYWSGIAEPPPGGAAGVLGQEPSNRHTDRVAGPSASPIR